ncbi:MAG: hypothetical protein J6A01_02085 [Proteobacteria bacterium]|nr:hypothetical protein [Pseudomonadota bacterium]
MIFPTINLSIHPIILIVMFAMHLLFVFPSAGNAQESVSELANNVNAFGKARTGEAKRVLAEIGMGVTGCAASLVVASGVGIITELATYDKTVFGDFFSEEPYTPLAHTDVGIHFRNKLVTNQQ